MSRLTIYTSLAMLVACVGCERTRITYTDADMRQAFPADLIEHSPYIIVAVAGTKVSEGPPGLVTRPHGRPPFPAQKYSFTLTVQRSLRGDLASGEVITVFGYESEALVMIGPPLGICGPKGELGIYFLRRSGPAFRVVVDDFRIRIPLDENTDLRVVERGGDVPVSIWRLMMSPLQSGLKPTTQNDLSEAQQATIGSLGGAAEVRLMLEAMRESPSADFRMEACLWLNTGYRGGYGLEGCALRLLKDSHLDDAHAQKLKAVLSGAPKARAPMRSILAEDRRRQLGFWAQGNDPRKIQAFLCLLSRHPDKEIARLATQALFVGWRDWSPSRPGACPD